MCFNEIGLYYVKIYLKNLSYDIHRCAFCMCIKKKCRHQKWNNIYDYWKGHEQKSKSKVFCVACLYWVKLYFEGCFLLLRLSDGQFVRPAVWKPRRLFRRRSGLVDDAQGCLQDEPQLPRLPCHLPFLQELVHQVNCPISLAFTRLHLSLFCHAHLNYIINTLAAAGFSSRHRFFP